MYLRYLSIWKAGCLDFLYNNYSRQLSDSLKNDSDKMISF